MSDPKQDILDLENQLPALKQKYEACLANFLLLPQDPARTTQRRESLHAWHSAGVAYFNAFDRLIATGSLTGADKDNIWYTDKAETSANLLDTIERHFRTLFAKAEELHLSRDMFGPSRTAFANMQRLVQNTDPKHASELRIRFQSAAIPTHGFDNEAAERPATFHVERRYFIVGCVCLLFGIMMAAWGFSLDEMKPHQYYILRWLLPLAGAFASGSFTGSMVTGSKKFWWSLTIAATGGFAVWLLQSLFLLNH